MTKDFTHEIRSITCDHNHEPDELEHIERMKVHDLPINVRKRELHAKKRNLVAKTAKYVVDIWWKVLIGDGFDTFDTMTQIFQ